MPTIPRTDTTPAEPQASLTAEERLLALEARAERDGRANAGRLSVFHQPYFAKHVSRLVKWFADGSFVYRHDKANMSMKYLTRDEALRLLEEAAS
jgi:hypothetical protein